MALELDEIRASTDCPVCAKELAISYKTLRLKRTIECPGCGETVRLLDETSISIVQALIDEANSTEN
jgi:peptide subunit release factor 1 (eRF1)